MEILERTDLSETARRFVNRGDWGKVGGVFNIRVFTSSAKKWTPDQRALIAEALERSAEIDRLRADLDWQGPRVFSF